MVRKRRGRSSLDSAGKPRRDRFKAPGFFGRPYGSDSPGPVYNLQNTFGVGSSSSKFSMRPRTTGGLPRSDSPGPGAYSVNDDDIGVVAKKKHKGVSLHKRFEKVAAKVERSTSPGPGAYDVRPRTSGASINISPSREKTSRTEHKRPGPGSYSIPSTIGQARAASLRGRKTEKVKEESPGPASIALPSTLSKGCSFSMSSRQKERESDTVGPIYFAEKPRRVATPAWTIGSERRPKVKTTDGPGPAAYNVDASSKYTCGHSPAAKMSGWNKDLGVSEARARSPGPGLYNLSSFNGVGHGGTFVTMKSRARVRDGEQALSPGPAAYNIPQPKATRVASLSGKTHKSAASGGSVSPSAASYSLPSTIGKGPAFSITPKRVTLSELKETSPGPAAYAVSPPKGNGGFSLAGKRQDVEVNGSPGPGQYSLCAGNIGTTKLGVSF